MILLPLCNVTTILQFYTAQFTLVQAHWVAIPYVLFSGPVPGRQLVRLYVLFSDSATLHILCIDVV